MTGAVTRLQSLPQILDAAALQRSLERLSHEIVERQGDTEELLLAGILTRGLPIARRIARNVARFSGAEPQVCGVDVTGFRDDRPHDPGVRSAPVTDERGGPAPVNGRSVILVDDVLYTGRTVRAALDALMSQGRPRGVEVLILIDRGHRELPLRATYVGKNVPTATSETVKVRLRETDGVDGAWLIPGADP